MCSPCLRAAATCPQRVLGTPEDLAVPAVSGTRCRLSPPLAGTTMAPVSSEPPGDTGTAPVMSSGTGTARVPAHPHSEEPTLNFTLRFLAGECSGGQEHGMDAAKTLGLNLQHSVPSPGWPQH